MSYDDIFEINFDKVNKKLVLDVKDITTEKFIGSMSQDRSNKVSEYSSKVRFLPDVKLSQKIQITCQFHSSKDSQYTGKHFPRCSGTRPPRARLDRMETRLRANTART